MKDKKSLEIILTMRATEMSLAFSSWEALFKVLTCFRPPILHAALPGKISSVANVYLTR